MEVSAKLSYLRIAPRKVRLIADLIRGKSVTEAENILTFTVNRAAKPALKLLKQAMSNAKNNFQLNEANLYIKKIIVNEGSKLKRWTVRARGQSSEIQKKTSHIIIILDEITETKQPISERGGENPSVSPSRKTDKRKADSQKPAGSVSSPQSGNSRPKVSGERAQGER